MVMFFLEKAHKRIKKKKSHTAGRYAIFSLVSCKYLTD